MEELCGVEEHNGEGGGGPELAQQGEEDLRVEVEEEGRPGDRALLGPRGPAGGHRGCRLVPRLSG